MAKIESLRAMWEGEHFNKLVVFDEAHMYIEIPDLVAGLVGIVREMRHKRTSVLLASQDPPSVPVALIELSTQIVLHRFNSPAWLKHIQKANAALASLSPEQLARLPSGEAYPGVRQGQRPGVHTRSRTHPGPSTGKASRRRNENRRLNLASRAENS